ncbi:MAG: efflux RND transporter periplasmic adaptor subunit [Alphaproteobacteria bacterium]|nr:efflux RND transporter periplasmic adaptor subunit [Alphaproteobacteria bacterium]
MLSKRNLTIVILVLALAGGGYYATSNSSNAESTKHSESDADAHGHENEAKPDHAEGGEHGHGDADEHAHGEKEAHAHGGTSETGGEEEGGHEETKISENAVQNMKIEVLEVGSALVQETISVTGRVSLNQNTAAQVKARFPGVIRSVLKEPGETVKANDTLATVESNDSLQVYPVKSPVAGLVISRNASVGEVAGETPLFVVADVSKLWAELFVFSRDGEKIKSGQKIHIQCLDDDLTAQATISVVLPTTEASSQTFVARAVIDNPENHWRSGMNIRADVVIKEKEVPVAVKTDAIQRLEGNDVIFIQESGGTYKAQPVELGTSDETWTEIKSGLVAGQRYVANNSFVVKAEIGKAGAEHAH